MNCIDVSEWNGEIDWNAAKADGVKYALIRCGFGQDNPKQTDKYFEINMENAFNAGIKIGVYFYSYAKDYDSATGEAEHCIRLIEPYRDMISLPVFYDIEESCNIPRIKDVVDGFRNKMEYHGYNVGVYTAISWYDAYFRPIDIDYIWLASWGSDDGQPHKKPEYCDIWQYTSKGSISGVGNKCVDCDIVYNTEMQLLIHPDPVPDPIPDPVPDPIPDPIQKKEVNITVKIDTPDDVIVNVNIERG